MQIEHTSLKKQVDDGGLVSNRNRSLTKQSSSWYLIISSIGILKRTHTKSKLDSSSNLEWLRKVPPWRILHGLFALIQILIIFIVINNN
jgi:hypothetical protein